MARDSDRKLAEQIDEIIVSIKAVAHELPERIAIAEQERQKERLRQDAERLEARRREAKRLTDESRKRSRGHLLALIDQWDVAKRISMFLAEAQAASERLAVDERTVTQGRLALAQQMFGANEILDVFAQWELPRQYVDD